MERRRRQKNETTNLQSIIYKSGKDPDGTGKSSVKSHLSRQKSAVENRRNSNHTENALATNQSYQDISKWGPNTSELVTRGISDKSYL